MKLRVIKKRFVVCKVEDITSINFSSAYVFLGKTTEEISCVCEEENIPGNYTEIEKGWRMLKIEGVLDFSLIGILAKISSILANAQIGIFVVSTFNTDYILVKEENLEKAVEALKREKYVFLEE